jgi:hypothetical protein
VLVGWCWVVPLICFPAILSGGTFTFKEQVSDPGGDYGGSDRYGSKGKGSDYGGSDRYDSR